MSASNREIPKVVRDGKVAVLVSPGYGAGWSTWADDAELAVFAPDVVAWVEAGKPEGVDFDHYGFCGGVKSVQVEWVPQGSRFFIDEYDGSESLQILGPEYGHLA